MKVAVIADIHANLTALQAVLTSCKNKYGPLQYIHLGDCVDYGMRPNEVIAEIQKLPMLVNIQGNHERAILGFDNDKFSSARGLAANNYTKKILTDASINYLNNMERGVLKIELEEKKILCVHGDMQDIYWGKMQEKEIHQSTYLDYDFVISGHTHIPSLRTVIDKENHHRTLFINPGSVGQPRNLNPCAQYCVLDLELSSIDFNAVRYDITTEQDLYNNEVDEYYKARIAFGL